MKKTKLIPYKSGEPFFPPNLSDFINHKWWTTFEAACVLTNWPQYEHSCTTLGPAEIIPKDILQERSWFILPSGEFNAKYYSQEFQDVFRSINEDIHNERIAGKHFLVIDGINKMVNPIDITLWAIKRNMELPADLQKALLIKQIKQRQPKPWQKKVKVMIASQYYKLVHADANKKEIINNPWVKKYALNIERENQQRQLHRDYGQISDKKSRGWNQEVHPTHIAPKMIPQVLNITENIFNCDFTLLEILLTTALWIKSSEIIGLDSICNLTLEEFMCLMKTDIIIRLYFEGSPKIISLFIEAVIQKTYYLIQDFFSWINIPKPMFDSFKITNEFFRENST